MPLVCHLYNEIKTNVNILYLALFNQVDHQPVLVTHHPSRYPVFIDTRSTPCPCTADPDPPLPVGTAGSPLMTSFGSRHHQSPSFKSGRYDRDPPAGPGVVTPASKGRQSVGSGQQDTVCMTTGSSGQSGGRLRNDSLNSSFTNLI